MYGNSFEIFPLASVLVPYVGCFFSGGVHTCLRALTLLLRLGRVGPGEMTCCSVSSLVFLALI